MSEIPPEARIEEKPRASAPRGSSYGGELPEITLPKPEDPETHYQRRRDRYVARLIQDMTIEEKAGQLIIPSLGDVAGPGVLRRGETLSRFLSTVRPGGFVLFTDNIHTSDQVRRLINELQADREIPLFIAVDEEGGVVSRLTRDPQMVATEIPSARRVGQSGDAEHAYQLSRITGRELRALGFNMNFAPVADVLTNPANQAIGSRAYGTDAEQVSSYVGAAVRGFQSTGVCAVLKHFPGHGDTAGDTHTGPVVVNHDLQRLRDLELLPFRAGMESGASAVMTGHIALPEVTGSNEAATFSRVLLQDLLRDAYAFDGVVISDALTMGAVTSRYSPEEAAIRALEAGVDILLRPVTPQEVHTAIIEAVHSGRLAVDRINSSVARVLRLKVDCGVLVPDDELFRARAAERPVPEPGVVGSAEHRAAVERIFGVRE